MSEQNNGLNICLMNDSFPPCIDGVATAMLNYANIITDKLGKATVVTPAYPEANDEEFPFPVVRYKSLSITEKICSYRMGYPFSASKLDALTDSGFDIIHSHCPFASMIMARVLRIKTGIPIVFTYHTKFDIDIKRVLPTKLMQEQAIKLIVANMSAADEVWTVSEGARQNLIDLGYDETPDRKIRIMENGVDFPRGRADKDKVAELKREYDIEGHPVFLFVGRLLWYKGIKQILDSLKILWDKGVDFRMMIVGDGADREEIEEYTEQLGLSEPVIFTGAVFDREELRTYYTAGDLFIFPSLYDTNGIVVREAAACGVPSLLIKGSCAAEGITNYRTGIFAENTPESLAQELIFAASHLDEIHQMGENAMNEVYMSWETSVTNAYRRYEEIIADFKNGKSSNTETDLQQDFFTGISETTDLIQRFRSIPAISAIRESNQRTLEKRRAFKEEKKKKEDINDN